VSMNTAPTDPRTDQPCTGCGQTFAWRDLDGLCGWCWESEHGLDDQGRQTHSGGIPYTA
jgi:hypothetical protein